jgi:ubiquinol-cytochrome c reductase subunit 7
MDIKEALARLPQEVVDARIQRLKRSMDLSMKHEYLPKEIQVLSLNSFPIVEVQHNVVLLCS